MVLLTNEVGQGLEFEDNEQGDNSLLSSLKSRPELISDNEERSEEVMIERAKKLELIGDEHTYEGTLERTSVSPRENLENFRDLMNGYDREGKDVKVVLTTRDYSETMYRNDEGGFDVPVMFNGFYVERDSPDNFHLHNPEENVNISDERFIQLLTVAKDDPTILLSQRVMIFSSEREQNGSD